MKKSIAIIMVAILAVLAIATTTVSAASLSVDKTTVKAGEEVTVTFKADNASEGIQFFLNYDAEAFEYASNSKPTDWLVTVGKDTPGLLRVIAAGPGDGENTADTITVTFKALKDAEEAKFSIDETTMVVDGSDETLAVKEVAVEVQKSDADSGEPETTPTTEPETTPTATATPKPTAKTTNNPKTGDSVAVYAGLAIVAIVAVAAVAKKLTK